MLAQPQHNNIILQGYAAVAYLCVYTCTMYMYVRTSRVFGT